MRLWVGLLGSVILGPDRRLRSEDLLAVAHQQGFAAARTVIASGNVIFEAQADLDEVDLSRRLTEGFRRLCGRDIPSVCRPAEDWPALLAANPYPAQAERSPASVSVRIMATAPQPQDLLLAQGRAKGGERAAIIGADLWAYTPEGFANSAMIRALSRPGVGRGTWRNSSAIAKIASACS